jgi:hypothetical protein
MQRTSIITRTSVKLLSNTPGPGMQASLLSLFEAASKVNYTQTNSLEASSWFGNMTTPSTRWLHYAEHKASPKTIAAQQRFCLWQQQTVLPNVALTAGAAEVTHCCCSFDCC